MSKDKNILELENKMRKKESKKADMVPFTFDQQIPYKFIFFDLPFLLVYYYDFDI